MAGELVLDDIVEFFEGLLQWRTDVGEPSAPREDVTTNLHIEWLIPDNSGVERKVDQDHLHVRPVDLPLLAHESSKIDFIGVSLSFHDRVCVHNRLLDDLLSVLLSESRNLVFQSLHCDYALPVLVDHHLFECPLLLWADQTSLLVEVAPIT